MNLKNWFSVRHMLPKGMDASDLPSSGTMYRKYLTLALPSVLEMVLISLINMMDTVMVSSVGTDAVAAVGLFGQPRMLMLCFFFAINTGITAVVARRKGEGRKEDANRVLRNSMVLIALLSLVLMGLFLPFASPLMRFAGAEEGRTLEDSTAYFIIVSAALPFNALSMGICAAQRGVGNTKLTMYVNVASNLVNILFNWLLINGIGPFPKLGVMGAAIATAIGLFVGFILSLISVISGKRHDPFLILARHARWKLTKEATGDGTHIALSSMVEQIALRIGFFSYAKIVAGLGTDAFAAHQIAMQFMNLSFSFADGFGIAGTSLVGQMLGARRKDLAHVYGTLAQKSAFLISIGLAMDCFAVSISKGLTVDVHEIFAKRQKPWLMAILFGAFQGGMPLIGYSVGTLFTTFFSRFAPWIALILLSFIGGKMIWASLQDSEENVKGNDFSIKTLVILAIATSFDALTTGVIFIPVPEVLWIGIGFIALTSFVFSIAGYLIGVFVGNKFKINVELIGGCILIAIGIKIFVEGLCF